MEIFNNNNEVRKLSKNVKKAFEAVKNELDDHLDAINQNTYDIQDSNSVIAELEAKLDKLAERIDDLEFMIKPKQTKNYDIKLTPREQEIFMILYMGKRFTSSEIAKRLGFTTNMVNMYLINLITKEVPIKKEMVDDLLVFSLDPEFKELQARRNVLEIDPRIIKQLALQEF